MHRLSVIVLIFTCFIILTGCASMMTQTSQYKGSDVMLQNRDVDAVIKKVESKKSKAYKKKDRVLEYLDLGMLYHYQGDYVKSNQLLEQAEQAIEESYTKSISKAALSMLLNDNALEYSGEDYEDIYTNVFKALNYLHQDKFDEAFVEIRRIDLKLSTLEDKYRKYSDELNSSKNKKTDFQAGTNKFSNSALGRYLSMIIYEQEGKLDDAIIDYNKIQEAFKVQPDIYNFNPPDLSDSLNQNAAPTLHVVSLIGSAPVKKEREYHIATSKNQLTIVSVDETIDPVIMFWPDIDPNYYFKFALPYIVDNPSVVGRVLVKIDTLRYELFKIEDIGNVAVQTYKIKEPIIYLKSITRAVLKGVAAEAAKDEMKDKNPGFAGSVMGLLTDIAVYATENADTRISRFFPNDVLVADIPVPEGEHNISIEYYDYNGDLLYTDDKGTVNIDKSYLNLIESWQLQ